MKNIFTIARKEIQAFFNNPTAYVVALCFVLVWEFLFFRNFFLIEEASLRSLFALLPWIFIIVVPALTMGSLAGEKNDGTLEFLLTRPLRQSELVIGKFLGVLVFLATILLFVFPLAWSLGRYGNFDWGQIAGQYLAAILMASVLASLGVFISGFFTSQISAFLVSVVTGFLLVVSGSEMISTRLPLWISPHLEQLSLSNHFDSMARGVIDIRDLWYFVSLTAVLLGFAYLNLIKGKFGSKKKIIREYQVASVFLLGIIVLSNVVGNRIPGRIDLTEDKIYTLSQTTREIVSDLPDIVNISLFASDKLPAQLQPVLRETKDVLNDYKSASKGKIRINHKNPSTDNEIADEALSLGIQPVRFNVISQEEFQVKDAFLGIAVSYADKNESIPFVQNIGDLEYQISSLIKQMTIENKPKIGFLSGHGEKSSYADYAAISEELKKQFQVEEIAAQSDNQKSGEEETTSEEKAEDEKKIELPDDLKTLVIPGPSQNFSESEKKVISEFVEKGGSLFLLADGALVSLETLSAVNNESNFLGYIKDMTGVEIKSNICYDLQSNETVGFGGGNTRYFLPYPFWPRVIKAQGSSPITSKIENLTLPWPSALEVDATKLSEKGYQKDDLYITTENAGIQTSSFNISPDQNFSKQGLSKKLMAVALYPKKDSQAKSRFVVVGDSDLLSDQFTGGNPTNFSFVIEVVSWLSQEPALSKIGVKNLAERKLVFDDNSQPNLVKFGNMAFVFLLVSGYGGIRLWKRKKMKQKEYST